MITWLVIGGLILLFGAVVFRGAPYVPTHRKSIEAALDIMQLKEGDVVVDLGSGDGAFLIAAAKRGYYALGYELNPLLCAIAWVRTLHWRDQVSVRLRDFWLTSLPPDTKAVFVFLASPYMQRFKRKIEQEVKERVTSLTVVSYGFSIPGMLPKRVAQGLYVYEIKSKP